MNSSYLITLSGEELQALIKKILLETITEVLSNNKPDNTPQIMHIKDAADYLRMSRSNLYTLTSARKIPFMKRAKRIYFRKEDLDRWLLEGKKDAL